MPKSHEQFLNKYLRENFFVKIHIIVHFQLRSKSIVRICKTDRRIISIRIASKHFLIRIYWHTLSTVIALSFLHIRMQISYLGIDKKYLVFINKEIWAYWCILYNASFFLIFKESFWSQCLRSLFFVEYAFIKF